MEPNTQTSSPLTDVADLTTSNDSSSYYSEDVESSNYKEKRSFSAGPAKKGNQKRQGSLNPSDSEEGVLLPDRKRPVPFWALNSQDRSGRTLLFKYASRGDCKTSEALLAAGASLKIADHAGWTPLHEACLAGHTDIVRLMLLYGADVDAPGGDGDTPLHDAVGNLHSEVVKLLLLFGASTEIVNEHGQNSLESAIEKLEELESQEDTEEKEIKDAREIVRVLKVWTEMSEKVVVKDESGQTVLHHACTNGLYADVVRYLRYGADVTAADNSGWTALHNAALNGHENIVEFLLRYGSNVNAVGFEDETPLHDAVANGHLNVVNILLQYGANVGAKNRAGKTPLDLILEDRKSDILPLLTKPAESWMPFKQAEFYPRLIGTKQEPTEKAETKETKKEAKEKPSFAWGGLDNREGPFESSREEKKFKALWQKIAKQDGKEGSSISVGEKLGRRNSDRGGLDGTFEMLKSTPKKTQLQPEVSKKTPKIASNQDKSGSLKSEKEEVKKGMLLINSEVVKKKADTVPEKVEKQEKVDKPVSKSQSSTLNEKANGKPDTPVQEKPKLDLKKSTPAPMRIESPKKNIDTKTPISISKPKENSTLKKKKRFVISGYQRAGDSNQNSELSMDTNNEISGTMSVDNSMVSEQVLKDEKLVNIDPVVVTKADGDEMEVDQKEEVKEVEVETVPTKDDGDKVELDVVNDISEQQIEENIERSESGALDQPVLDEVKVNDTTLGKRKSISEDTENTVKPEPIATRERSIGVPKFKRSKGPTLPLKKAILSEFLNDRVVEAPICKDTAKSLPSNDISIKYCLPLCAYDYKEADPFTFTNSTTISDKWSANFLLPNTRKVFIDLQLAFCLGLSSGRELIEKYPALRTRVANTLEKQALEKTILSHSLLQSMLSRTNRQWLRIETYNNREILKLSDIDIHIVYWDETLYNILSKYISISEPVVGNQTEWMRDLQWPCKEEITAKAESIAKTYVHKLKRLKRV